MAGLLEVRGLEVRYGEARALSGVDVDVAAGQALAVLGPNGAGKSSLAQALAGLVRPAGGRVVFDGTDITGWPAHRISRLGLAHVPEGRGVFPGLTVRDNLRMTLRHAVARDGRAEALGRAFELFPILASRRHQLAGTLSGGEQQMLALARVLAVPPRLLIADEMSLGLAPMLIDAIFESLQAARAEGVTVVLVEQFVERALAFADSAVILRQGAVCWHGPAEQARDAALELYLGA